MLATNDLSFKDKDQELEDLVYLGWPIIRLINRWFTINLFDWLSSWGLSMGIVILLMTIIVKILVEIIYLFSKNACIKALCR